MIIYETQKNNMSLEPHIHYRLGLEHLKAGRYKAATECLINAEAHRRACVKMVQRSKDPYYKAAVQVDGFFTVYDLLRFFHEHALYEEEVRLTRRLLKLPL